MNPPSESEPITSPQAGIPGWRRAPCLGCGQRVVAARDGWVTFGGTLDGSYVIAWGTEPLLAYATDPDATPTADVFLLGVAHQACAPAAYQRVRSGVVRPTSMSALLVESGEQVPDSRYTLHQPAQPDACPFCDSTVNLTREDVWPRWYSKFLRDTGWSVTGRETTRGGIAVYVPVCAACNNEWMSVLENDASKLLLQMMSFTPTQPPIELSVPDQTLLSTWAVKTAYMIDAHVQPVIPRGFLHRFALHRKPDVWTWIWLSACRPDHAVRAAKRPLDFLTPNGSTQNSPNSVLITFTIFDVLFQIVMHFNGGTATMTDRREQYREALLPIWPPTPEGLIWPPQLGFNKDSFDDLVASIQP